MIVSHAIPQTLSGNPQHLIFIMIIMFLQVHILPLQIIVLIAIREIIIKPQTHVTNVTQTIITRRRIPITCQPSLEQIVRYAILNLHGNLLPLTMMVSTFLSTAENIMVNGINVQIVTPLQEIILHSVVLTAMNIIKQIQMNNIRVFRIMYTIVQHVLSATRMVRKRVCQNGSIK